MHNEMDAAMYSISGINDRSLYEISFGLPPRLRLTKRFLLRAIDALDIRMSGIAVK
jgi:hypothetical protein